MASKSKKVPPQKRVSSFTQSMDQKNQDKVGKSILCASTPIAPKKRQPLSKGKVAGVTKTPGIAIGAKQVPYTKEAEERFDAILEGNFDDVPALPRSTVRIFLSSTFSDMRAERNALAREAYPKLRDYCAGLGLSFQVVDLRWGITSEATNNHVTTNICLLELKNCQKISLGLSCIALLGNRYGFCPLPNEIPPDEYDLLSKEASSLGLEGASIISTWYLRDDNAVPPVFYLQPITSQLPDYLNEKSGQEKKRESSVKTWAQIESQLIEAIHKAALSCASKGSITAERAHFYIMSVTEHEARNGVLPGTHALAFLRELQGLDGGRLMDSMAHRHKEVITQEDGQVVINKDIENLLSSLKKYITSTLEEKNRKQYDVPWEPEGLNPNSVESHAQYISKFCSDFIAGVKNLIDSDIQMSQSLIRAREYYSQYNESLHHAHFCKMKCQSFCGQAETLERIKSYILDASNRNPFVIHAQSGVGKTSIMAKAMDSLKSWIPGQFTGIIRFLGTSPNSTNIYSVLFSVCGQMADASDSIMEPQGYKTMKSFQRYLPRFFRSMSSALKMPIIIFLDSIDQLEPTYDAYSMKWLPKVLPSNLKLIISTLSNEHGILENLHSIIADPANIFQVPLLSDDTSHEIVQKYFSHKNRCITEDQMKLLIETFRKAASPLYLKLLMDQAIFWKSYDKASSIELPVSIKSAINILFEKLEIKFGFKIVQSALGLISVGLNGLSDIELEDAVSCVDEALIEIYKYHDPPVPGMIRVPPVLWARIRSDINEYLVERQSQEITTLFWYHRQFIEAAHEKYVHGEKGENLHRVLFEMYASENGIKRDIILTQRKNLKIENADRYTNPQPTTPKNLRKLECMSYHLKNCYKCIDKEFALNSSYCDIRFLQAKVASIGVDKLIIELQDFVKITKSPAIKSLLKFVSSSKNSLNNDVTLAFKILVQIDALPTDTNLNHLKKQAKDFLESQNKLMLIPSHASLAKRSGEPEKVYDNLSYLFIQNNELCLLTDDWDEKNMELENTKTLTCLDLKTADIMKYACENMNSKPYLTLDGKMIFYLSESELMLVKLAVSSGTIYRSPLTDVFHASIKVFAGNISRGNCCITGSQNGNLLAMSILDKISIMSTSDMKKTHQLDSKDSQNISNLHICNNSTLVLVGKYYKGGIAQSENIIQVWTHSPTIKQKLSFTADVSVESGCSALTFDDSLHICFGWNKESSKGLIILTNLKTFMEEKIEVKEEIKDMKTSSTDSMGLFQVGKDKLMLMNFSDGKFVSSYQHGRTITSWAVNWEEESIMVSDEKGDVTLLNLEMEKTMTRNWAHGNISAVSHYQEHIMLLTDRKAKIWNADEFFQNEKSQDSTEIDRGSIEDGNHLKLEDDVQSFVITDGNREMITSHPNLCKVWSLENYCLLYKIDVQISATKLLMALDGKVVTFDQNAKRVIIFSYKEKKILCNDLPENIMCMTMTKDRSNLILVTSDLKPVIYIYDLKSNSSSKKCTVNINFKCLHGEVILTPSERYLVFMLKNTEEDYKEIAEMWKAGNFHHQNHPYRFVAIDLSQSSGAAMYAYHRLSKIPHLGVTFEPYRGNQVLISTRRWVICWDIPTGRCDQSLSKKTRKTTMYRPDWLGQHCVGDNDVVCMSFDNIYTAVGSQDGYVFVYEAESGMPVGMKAPSSKHPSPVNQIAFSHSNQLLASSCTSGLLKLWFTTSGECIFSASLGVELRQLHFTSDHSKLIGLTQAEKSHMVVFNVAHLEE